MNDPYMAGARALRDARDKGMITEPQYQDMYRALAAAAEGDAVACSIPGCQRAAYIGTRCAHHTDKELIRRMVAEAGHHAR